MGNYALSRFTSPNAGVTVSEAGTDISTTAALGQAIQNLDTNAAALTAAGTWTVAQAFNGGFTTVAGTQFGSPTGGDKGAGTINAAGGLYDNGTRVPAATPITNSLAANVALNNITTYFDGPSVAQGTSGTWFASGTVTVLDSGGGANFKAKLWDGTTVIASMQVNSTAANLPVSISLSGSLTSPAGNIRISVEDTTATTGSMRANDVTAKDSTLTVVRIG